jgi:hypothetical protein
MDKLIFTAKRDLLVKLALDLVGFMEEYKLKKDDQKAVEKIFTLICAAGDKLSKEIKENY